LSDWTPSTSYTAPAPEANTLADLIRDLTQTADLDASTDPVGADATTISEPDFTDWPARTNSTDSANAGEAITLENLFADFASEPEAVAETIPADALTLADLFAEPVAADPERAESAEAMTLADLFSESSAEPARPALPEPPVTLADLFASAESARPADATAGEETEETEETVTATDLFADTLEFDQESATPAETFADWFAEDHAPAVIEPDSRPAEPATLTDWFGDSTESPEMMEQAESSSTPTLESVTDWFANFAETVAPDPEPSASSQLLDSSVYAAPEPGVEEVAAAVEQDAASHQEAGEANEAAPVTIEPAPEPDLSEPDLSEPDLSEPDLSEPDLSEPDLFADFEPVPDLALSPDLAPSQAIDLEPAPLIAPATVEPATIAPATVEPATVEPATVEPATVEPVTVEPVTADLKAVPAPVAVPIEPVNQPTAELVPDPELFAQAASESAASELDAALLAQLDDLLAEPPLPVESEAASAQWFLGIDIGTTGISAVLLNRPQCRLYPLYWQSTSSDFPTRRQFRLSTAVTLLTDEPRAFPLPTIRIEPTPNTTLQTIAYWKPYLKIAVPHYSPQTSRWEPVLQWAEQQTLPLRTVQEVLQQLLATLNPDRASFLPALTCGALGLEPAEFQTVLRQLNSVVVGYPSNWPDTYSFNLREAILQAELVPSPTQIVFLEEAVAALLSALPATDRRTISLSQAQGQSGHLHNADWQGVTLILTAGTIVTELVMVNLPPQLQALNPTDFYTRSLPLAGYSLDQDIVSQLLYPALSRLLESNHADGEPANTAELAPDLILEHWDATFDLAQLKLASDDFPAAAALEPAKRYRLQQQLSQTSSGQTLLNLAHALKITLQFQPRFVVQWHTQRLVFDRQMLTSRVLLPYIQRLNRELNTLLAQTNTTAAAVQQVLCTGGTASLAAITRWLRQKLPNATIVQDTYPQPASLTPSCLPSCSRVAYGLAALPLHPQVIDQSRHQFSDYLLLKALLKVMPTQPTRVSTVMQLLEQQGIDTQACRFRILALLEGHLPPGLIPAEADLPLLAPESAHNPDYPAIRLAPLLLKHADRTYEPNPPVWAYLQQYLDTLLADTEQILDHPLQPALTPLNQLNQTQNLS
jgi:hypothetical protein